MKTKSVYRLAAGMLFSASLAIGQTPTTQPTQGTNYNTINQSNGRQINSTALPDPLRSTLQGNRQYEGWENGQWYFNQSTNQYSLQMPSSNTGTNTINSVTPSTQLNPATPTSTTPTSPTSPSPTSPVSPPNSPNPMGGLQTTPASPVTTTQPVWYRFDQNGKLIPQSKPQQ